MEWLIDQIKGIHPVQQALIATFFTWGVTALGAALVFFFQKHQSKNTGCHVILKS